MGTHRLAVAVVLLCLVAGCTSKTRAVQPTASSSGTIASSGSAGPTAPASAISSDGSQSSGAASSPAPTVSPIGDGSANAKAACAAFTGVIADLNQNPPAVEAAVAGLATMTASVAAARTANADKWAKLATDMHALATSISAGSFIRRPGAGDAFVVPVTRDCG